MGPEPATAVLETPCPEPQTHTHAHVQARTLAQGGRAWLAGRPVRTSGLCAAPLTPLPCKAVHREAPGRALDPWGAGSGTNL